MKSQAQKEPVTSKEGANNYEISEIIATIRKIRNGYLFS